MVQTRNGFAYNNVTRLTDNINDIDFTFQPSIQDGIIDLFLLLSHVEFINTDSIGTCLNCDYLRSRYEVLFIEIIDVYEEVYARIIFYKMKHFILVNVIISNIDGKCVNTTNNESLLMCIGANNYRFIIIEDIPNILFDCINNDNCVYGNSTYVHTRLTTTGIKGYCEYYLHIVIRPQELVVWLNLVQIGIKDKNGLTVLVNHYVLNHI